MFTQRASGRSIASLARELNERGVPCPSNVDQARNSHRSGARWIVRTIAMILANPRYTGRQVWNRQTTKGHGAGGRADGRGSGAASWNPVQEWEVSEHLAHTPLVDEDTFVAVQRIRAQRPTKDGDTRDYVLAGLVVCGVCGRRMDAHWIYHRPTYRCRHGYTSGTPRPSDAPRNVYIREDRLLQALPGLLEELRLVQADLAEPFALAEALRRHELEIVCNHQGRCLRRAAPPKIISTLTSPGQTALALDWNVNAADHHRQQGASASAAMQSRTDTAPHRNNPTDRRSVE
ncbi:recombinase family protein [Allokutzneria oryzae]|uniref:Recombinase family protein n=1 Tax=Allokutzneria oryzae TaxID=1378989 RepID=A0ABV5ZZA2_9PSEU